jgi:hypothetical protein
LQAFGSEHQGFPLLAAGAGVVAGALFGWKIRCTVPSPPLSPVIWLVWVL